MLVLWVLMLIVWWGFAFIPGSPPPDSWIAAARAACFGSAPGGVPEGYGWMLLTLAPLMLLSVMLVAFNTEIRAGLRTLKHGPLWRVLSIVLVVGFVAELGWAAVQIERAGRVTGISYEPQVAGALPPNYPRQDKALPAFRLLDQTGADFDDTMLRGEPTVVSFVFAHCQTVCPVLATNTKKAIAQLGDDQVRLMLVTLDPWRDTPASLATLAERWELPGTARLLSGEPARVEALLDAFNVARQRDDSNGDIVHPPLVYIIDGDGRIAYMLNNPPVDWIVEGVRRVEAAS